MADTGLTGATQNISVRAKSEQNKMATLICLYGDNVIDLSSNSFYKEASQSSGVSEM
jgi:hypothetical protein